MGILRVRVRIRVRVKVKQFRQTILGRRLKIYQVSSSSSRASHAVSMARESQLV
eukprot:CAMPEP_0118882414 /NCGR_PEP_ID=MMETSP1163-20130328/21679_1 /TAXON_ID=124430 /ORGANISM="Phaeomonas parva, Strain CCMP2877" /LENGTH=53 /DNA_ID=CAMNT_0006819471 /DNA_START=58 /DNA_END=216 /DNA_ORIENTATION=+